MTSSRAIRYCLLGLSILLATVVPVHAADASIETPAADEGQQLFTPQPVEMGECITCVGSYATSIDWGTGSNCDEARQNLDSQLRSTALNDCRSFGARTSCDFQVTVTAQCSFDCQGGYYVVDGYATYGCLEGDYFCQY